MSATWILLLYTLPKGKGRQRVDLWRQLQRFGCLPLNTSAYILPDRPSCHERLQWLAKRILDAGGEATVSKVLLIEGLSNEEIQARFNAQRDEDYAGLLKQATALAKRIPRQSGNRVMRGIERLRRLARQIEEIDYFEAAKRKDLEDALDRLEKAVAGGAGIGVPPLERNDYLGSLWITRPYPEIDRCASAWLIQKFIDSKATFGFAGEGPPDPAAITFDMLDGDFTHQGDACTFETLCQRFGVNDPAVLEIGEMVHDADLEDEKFDRIEAIGIDRLLKGLAEMNKSSEEILTAGIAAIEAIYYVLKRKKS